MHDTGIVPALSREEWTRRWVRDGFGNTIHVHEDGGMAFVFSQYVYQAEGTAALVALANAALPADDPRKITREHVEAIDALAKEAHVDYTLDDFTPPSVRGLLALRAALNAILPPEQ